MVLEALYYGNIDPVEQAVVHNKGYQKLHGQIGELLTQLEEQLSKEQMGLVNRFHSRLIDAQGMEGEANFRYGFALGMLLMKEVHDLLPEMGKG